MRCGIQEVPPLAESLLDERILVVVEFEDGLLKVSDASVDKLCTLTAGSRSKVIALYESDLETTGSSIKSDASPGCTTTNDEQVILLTSF